MPTPTTCHDIFNAAQAERAKCPLTSGKYKLEEARQTIDGLHTLVTTIADRVRARGKFGEAENLGPCMAHERGAYLKAIPSRLAELIGNKILPAIAALEGDGVPKAEVERRLSRAETDARRVLAECEAVRQTLKSGIKHEYEAMGRGESKLLGLLKGVLAFAMPELV